ncbi:MAG: hypothetical protein SVM80_11540 [Halobacteriota archaeon]|nr:hypothetical protein [Halobacteriota archaeon]
MEINTMTFYLLMLVATLPLFAFQLKLSMFPEARGSIVKFDSVAACFERCGMVDDNMELDLDDIKRRSGKMSVGVRVRLEDGNEVEAIVSPCNICLEKLTVGSKVAINKINGEYQVHPLMWGG